MSDDILFVQKLIQVRSEMVEYFQCTWVEKKKKKNLVPKLLFDSCLVV